MLEALRNAGRLQDAQRVTDRRHAGQPGAQAAGDVALVDTAVAEGLGTCWIGPGADHESVIGHLGDRFGQPYS